MAKVFASFQQLEELLDTLPAALVLIGPDETVLFYNEEARSLFQVPSLSPTRPASRTYPTSPESLTPATTPVPPVFRLGDLVSCKYRTLTPLGCGFSDNCSGCVFFQMIRKGLSHLNEPFRETGIAQVSRYTPPFLLWFRYTARPVRWGNQRALVISFEDVTSLKVKEQELDVRRAHFEHLFQHAPVAIAILDDEDRFLDCNLQFSELFQYTVEEIRGKPINDLIVPTGLEEEASTLSKAVLAGTLIQKESVRQRKDGTRFPVAILGAPITIAGKKYIYAIYQDISLRKEMERRILGLLKEKELILKEVHHRIKNNMTLIISLLSLERSFLKDSEAIKALEEAEGRIRSMEVLYEKLYRSELIHSAPLKEYLEELVEEIVALFPKRERIRTILTIPPLEMDPKTLSALGLIVNELITNSMKYAFTDRSSGSISLEITVHKGIVRFRYDDDGIGFPEGFTLDRSERFGLQLVSLLTEQLGGTIHIEEGKGACFVIEFPYSFQTSTLMS